MSRYPTQADTPSAPNKITKAGVKQQSAAITVPRIPVFNNFRFIDLFTAGFFVPLYRGTGKISERTKNTTVSF